MASNNYTRIILRERPITNIVPSTFRSEVLPLDLKPEDAQVLVKVNWLSLDPAMRGWLRDTRSYVPPVQIGEVMRATGLGTVVEAGRGSHFEEGDIVQGTFGELMMGQFLPRVVLTSSSQVGRNTL
jgi:NADPH-dependent curcumin reductase CurA